MQSCTAALLPSQSTLTGRWAGGVLPLSACSLASNNGAGRREVTPSLPVPT